LLCCAMHGYEKGGFPSNQRTDTEPLLPSARTVPEADTAEAQGNPYTELSVAWGYPVSRMGSMADASGNDQRACGIVTLFADYRHSLPDLTHFAMSVERGEALYGSELERGAAEGMVRAGREGRGGRKLRHYKESARGCAAISALPVV
jgi:hypothetical protein